MRKQAQHKPTFKQIVDEVAEANFRTLMEKARQFSRLAKTVNGYSRRLAYSRKAMCLKQIVEKNPKARVNRDWQAMDHELLSVRLGRKRLHTKWQWLEAVA
jgi:hypothetical protein